MGSTMRLAGLGAALAVVAASVIVGTGTADAATGGGCTPVGPFPYGNGNVCIGATRPTVARPDAYLSLSASHPACTVRIRAERSDGAGASSWQSTTCPSGATSHWHVVGLYFSAQNRSSWRNHTEIDYSNHVVATNYSPWLNMP